MSPLIQVGHDVQLVAFDGEKAIDCKDAEAMIGNLRARLDVNPGTHIGMIENDTRYAKNKLRGLQATFPVPVNGLKLMILILVICSLYLTGNYFPCTANYGNCPPWEALFGEKITYDRHLKHHPGELVEAYTAHGPQSNKYDLSKTTPAIALVGTGASNCSYRCIHIAYILQK